MSVASSPPPQRPATSLALRAWNRLRGHVLDLSRPSSGRDGVLLVEDAPRDDLRLGLLTAVLFFGVFGGWAALAPLNAAVHAPGAVVVADSRRVVQTQDGGTIDAIHVRDGDRVEAGTILIEMRAGEARAELEALEAQWIELTALLARLLAEETGRGTIIPPPEWTTDLDAEAQAQATRVLARQQSELEARRNYLASQQGILGSRRNQLDAQIGGLGAQRAAYERQRMLLSEELAAVRSLYERGLAPVSRVRGLERAMAQIDVDLAGLDGSEARAREAIGETAMQGMSIEDQERVRRSEDLRRTDQMLADVAPRLEAARARFERAVLRAPTTGVVVGLTGHTVGAVAPPGGRILEIVPEDDELVIDAQVAPQHADDVSDGMAAEIRFPGLTGRALPILSGVVETISADRLIDERTGAPYFIARVRVDPESLAALTQTHPRGLDGLGPGLPAEVLITLRPRTALQYLVEPLDQTLWRSFRES
jgi:HlyD family secretion protein